MVADTLMLDRTVAYNSGDAAGFARSLERHLATYLGVQVERRRFDEFLGILVTSTTRASKPNRLLAVNDLFTDSAAISFYVHVAAHVMLGHAAANSAITEPLPRGSDLWPRESDTDIRVHQEADVLARQILDACADGTSEVVRATVTQRLIDAGMTPQAAEAICASLPGANVIRLRALRSAARMSLTRPVIQELLRVVRGFYHAAGLSGTSWARASLVREARETLCYAEVRSATSRRLPR